MYVYTYLVATEYGPRILNRIFSSGFGHAQLHSALRDSKTGQESHRRHAQMDSNQWQKDKRRTLQIGLH